MSRNYIPPSILTVTLSLPHRSLSPNARVHWGERARRKSAYRAEGAIEAHNEKMARGGWVPLKAATVTAVFYWPDRRRRDKDNALASLKSAFDGLQDAGIIEDDAGITHAPSEFRVDRGRPRVELRISGMKARRRCTPPS